MVADTRLSRLRHAVGQHARLQPPSNRPAPVAALPPLDVILRGDWHDTAEGPVFVRDEWFPIDHRHGAAPLAAALDAPDGALARLLRADQAPPPSALAFFDIETTGLSGGTGTWVILAGLGSYEEGAFRLRQYFLADVAYERAMLAMLAADLARFDGLVTYNGRAFDLPFVQTRMMLARVDHACARLAHVDLLHAVRRLYRHRLEGCRLADAEAHLLRIRRSDDIPGSVIPGIYFDYVRAGRVSPLRALFRHNGDDVLSLVGVLAACARLVSTDDLDPDDAIAAARWWECAGDRGRASALYERALPWLDGGGDWEWVAGRLARLLKRAGRHADALPLWERLWSAGDAHAGVEVAKHYEHRRRDPGAALAVTRRLLECAGPGALPLLERREARLRRKVARPRAARSRSGPPHRSR